MRNTIQTADAFVYAFTISDHYTHSSFKCFDDRQFCNGHRTVTHGTPIAYLISGDYRYEGNLRMILEGRSEVGGNYLCGVATDEGDTRAALQTLADALALCPGEEAVPPRQFLRRERLPSAGRTAVRPQLRQGALCPDEVCGQAKALRESCLALFAEFLPREGGESPRGDSPPFVSVSYCSSVLCAPAGTCPPPSGCWPGRSPPCRAGLSEE